PTSGITTTTIVNVTVVNPDGVAASLADGFTYYVAPVAPEKIVTSVDFSEETGKKLLTITGTGLVGGSNPGEYVEAIIRSLVTLNNTALPFCAEGLGVSAQDIIDAYAGAGYDLNGLVSDNPPCYDLIKDGSTVAIDQTHATIQLPDNFDTTAQGTVSVNGSNTYTFNATGGGPVTPSANVNGDKSLGDTPTIPKRPTFSGTAEPGATITVTVHSDPVICTTTADSSGNWSCTLPSDLEPGVHTVFIHIVNPNSSIVDLGPYTVTVAGTTITNNTPLGPNTGFLQAIKEHKAQASLKQTVTIAGVSTTIILLVGITGFVVRKKRSSRIVFNR
ncbi:MAG: Ig-like domain-containing protein, partial [Candidatus Saccharibacteria bacterium]